MKARLMVFAVLFLSLAAQAQMCSTPQVSNFQDGTVSIAYNCTTVHPGQNAPFHVVDMESVQVIGPRHFSSISLSYHVGYIIYGNASSMVSTFTLPDAHGLGSTPFVVTGVGPYNNTIGGGFDLLAQDTFRVNQDISLNGYIVANCLSSCGYSLVITLNP